MVKSFDELKESLKAVVGDNTNDEVLSFVEDFTDTFSDLQKRNSSADEWKSKAEAIDNEWREKYRSRFFESETEEEEVPRPEYKPMTYESLFSE